MSGVIRFFCPYECSWSLDVDDTALADEAAIKMWTPEFALRARGARIDASLRAHLDAQHPRWTMHELESLARRRAAAELLQEYEVEHGVIAEEELQQLDSEWLT